MTQASTSIAMKRDTIECRISETKVRVLAAVKLHAIVARLQKINSEEAIRIGDELLDLADWYLRGNK